MSTEKLSRDWADFDFGSEKAMQRMSDAVSKAADALNRTLNLNMNTNTNTSTNSGKDFDISSRPAQSADSRAIDSDSDMDMARTQAMVRYASMTE